jgi:molybdenum cofactor cytidylyltransferase
MITAIILAAGESKRMGQSKMLLPWGNNTVLSHVVSIFQNAGVEDIVVVTGGYMTQVIKSLEKLKVRTTHNDEFANGEMLLSIQCGIKAVRSQTQAVLIGLGDQPQVQERSVRMVCDAYREEKSSIIVPSFQMRRGHPWLVARPFWGELLDMAAPQSPRDFLNAHQREIKYIEVDDANILADLDTPEDYEKWRP